MLTVNDFATKYPPTKSIKGSGLYKGVHRTQVRTNAGRPYEVQAQVPGNKYNTSFGSYFTEQVAGSVYTFLTVLGLYGMKNKRPVSLGIRNKTELMAYLQENLTPDAFQYFFPDSPLDSATVLMAMHDTTPATATKAPKLPACRFYLVDGSLADDPQTVQLEGELTLLAAYHKDPATFRCTVQTVDFDRSAVTRDEIFWWATDACPDMIDALNTKRRRSS